MNPLDLIKVLAIGNSFRHKEFWQDNAKARIQVGVVVSFIVSIFPHLAPDMVQELVNQVPTIVAGIGSYQIGHVPFDATFLNSIKSLAMFAIGLLFTWMQHKYFQIGCDATAGIKVGGNSDVKTGSADLPLQSNVPSGTEVSVSAQATANKDRGVGVSTNNKNTNSAESDFIRSLGN